MSDEEFGSGRPMSLGKMTEIFEQRLETLIGKASGMELDYARKAWSESMNVHQGSHDYESNIFTFSSNIGFVGAEVPVALLNGAYEDVLATKAINLGRDEFAGLVARAIDQYVALRMLEPGDDHALYSASTPLMLAAAALIWHLNMTNNAPAFTKKRDWGAGCFVIFAHTIKMLPEKGEASGTTSLLLLSRWQKSATIN